jgi:hypothetical protein
MVQASGRSHKRSTVDAAATARAHRRQVLQHPNQPLTHPGPRQCLSRVLRAGSVQQLQKKPTQQHSFMKRRMRSE